jgi:hypothetical protein
VGGPKLSRRVRSRDDNTRVTVRIKSQTVSFDYYVCSSTSTADGSWATETESIGSQSQPMVTPADSASSSSH